MMISGVCERLRDRRPQEKCASKCVRCSVSLCLHLFFSIDKFIVHFWKGSLTGKAVVLKTIARSRLRVRILSLPPMEASPNGMAAVC